VTPAYYGEDQTDARLLAEAEKVRFWMRVFGLECWGLGIGKSAGVGWWDQV
jgi:hypothetical protein